MTYLPSELDQRLRTWAALLGLPTSHLLAQVITEATPSRDQLAEMVQASAAATAIPGSAPPTAAAGSASPDVRTLMQPSPSPALQRSGPPRALRTPAAALDPIPRNRERNHQ